MIPVPRTTPRHHRSGAPGGRTMAGRRVLTRTFVVALFGSLLTVSLMSSPVQAVSTPAQAPAPTEYFLGGRTYFAGTSRTSQNGAYQLRLQSDGNFVLYHRANGHVVPIWASNTTSTSPWVAMANTGRVTVNGSPSWTSGISFPENRAFLKVQNDGKLVVYRGDPNGGATAWYWNCRWNPNRRPNFGFCPV